MFDYAQKLQLAVSDAGRRLGMKAAAGVVVAVALGFLIAALWSWLAVEMALGSAMASLIVGGGLLLCAAILMAMAGRKRHAMPTTDELKREVEARVSLAADAAADRARAEAARLADMAQNRVHALMDDAGYRANKLAEDAERRVTGLVRDTAQTVGLTSGNLQAAREGVARVRQGATRASSSNAGSMAKLIGAFAVGVTIAARLQEGRRSADRDFDPDDVM
ncbi:phage holin family protein [Paracoccus spongiarum]|uniref:Phage holin family protein n=1 Tax=Paracoccus spongiarum TaxID=3064387 RepID=A0ABT9JE13_9RHOB|nr:phage holin family protein [Paracoccus sp. 2205BS29-5]MDP5308068.1 phage holin family protein [Paracoccus sp. 2205BS29-5]